MFLLVVLCWSCSPQPIPQGVDEAGEITNTEDVFTTPKLDISPSRTTTPKVNNNKYTNDKFGYSVFYPDHWYPSGIAYANAFELRNYRPQNPESIPESNWATLIIVDTVNENSEATQEFLDNLISTNESSEYQSLTIDGHRAVRVNKKVPAKQLSPGASITPDLESSSEEIDFYYAISTYIANGQNLISIEASFPAKADSSVFEDVYQISNSVMFP